MRAPGHLHTKHGCHLCVDKEAMGGAKYHFQVDHGVFRVFFLLGKRPREACGSSLGKKTECGFLRPGEGHTMPLAHTHVLPPHCAQVKASPCCFPIDTDLL